MLTVERGRQRMKERIMKAGSLIAGKAQMVSGGCRRYKRGKWWCERVL